MDIISSPRFSELDLFPSLLELFVINVILILEHCLYRSNYGLVRNGILKVVVYIRKY